VSLRHGANETTYSRVDDRMAATADPIVATANAAIADDAAAERSYAPWTTAKRHLIYATSIAGLDASSLRLAGNVSRCGYTYSSWYYRYTRSPHRLITSNPSTPRCKRQPYPSNSHHDHNDDHLLTASPLRLVWLWLQLPALKTRDGRRRHDDGRNGDGLNDDDGANDDDEHDAQ